MTPPGGRNVPISPDEAGTSPPYGCDTPRLETPTADVEGRGQELIDLAVELGRPLMPWQAHVALRSMAGSPGDWSHQRVGVIVPRQQGKSALLQIRIIWGLLNGEKLIVATAQSREVALETFRGVADLLLDGPYQKLVKTVRYANGQETIELTNGCRYKILAPTPSAARGLTAHLAIMDEIREHKNYGVWAALVPTTTVPRGQVWFASNAGDDTSVVLNDLREKALTQTKPGAIYYAEWSADPSFDVADPEGWLQANPAIGHTVDLDTLKEAYETDPRPVFETERLSRWVANIQSPWPPNAVVDAVDPDLEFVKGLPTWLAVDVSIDRRHAALVAVQLREDETLAAHLLRTWFADGAIDDLLVASEVAPVAREYAARSVSFDRYTAAGIAGRLASVGIPVGDCSGGEFAQASDELLSAMVHGRLKLQDQETLIEHLLACAKKPYSDGGWRIVRRSSAGPIAGAVALAMAVHFALRPMPRAEVLFA
jgi:phage terminase large subunit-like protein